MCVFVLVAMGHVHGSLLIMKGVIKGVLFFREVFELGSAASYSTVLNSRFPTFPLNRTFSVHPV